MEQDKLKLLNEFFFSKTTLTIHSLHEYLEQKDYSNQVSKIVEFKKGECIYNPKKQFIGVYEVLSGAVRISNFTESGEEVTSDVLTNADIFGNLKSTSHMLTEYSKALTDSTIRIYDINSFTKLKFTDPNIAAWFNDYIISRWAKLEGRLLRLNTFKPSENVTFLYEVFNKKIINSKGKELCLLNLITQKDIADIIGVTRQTVSSVIREIEHRGI